MKACSDCSAQVIESAKFCSNCGSKLEQSPMHDVHERIIPRGSGDLNTLQPNDDVGAISSQLDGALAVTVLEKGFHQANLAFHDFQDLFTAKVQYSNLGTKGIRALKQVEEIREVFVVW
jgi:hypothetical protein